MPNDLKIVIDNREIIVESATLLKTMDTGADACSAVMPWKPGLDSQLDEITKPYSYKNAKIYIDDKLVSEQVLYDITQETTTAGTTKKLDFWSKTADIIDSTVIAPYEMNNVKLTDRCKQQCAPYGINVIVGDDAEKNLNETRRVIVDTGKTREFTIGATFTNTLDLKPITKTIAITKSKYVTDEKKFPRVKAEPTDTIFSHLAKLAAQRGLLLSCTTQGDLLITTANINGKPVGTIAEGLSGLSDIYSAKFSGRNRFNRYRAIVKSSSSGRTAGTQSTTDLVVVAPRLLTFNANDNIPGEAKSAAEWRKNKSAADAMSMSFPVNSWYAPDGNLWQPNTTVTIISETMSAKNGFTFLITSVEFVFNNSGCTAKLELKPPSVYSDGIIKEPWG